MMRFELENEEGLRPARSRIRATLTSLTLPVAESSGRCCWAAPTRPTSPSRYGWGPWRGLCQPHRRRRLGAGRPVLDAGRQPGGQLPATAGATGFHRRTWQIKEQEADGVKLALLSRAGDQGFPGNLRVSLEYRLEQCGLVVDFCASTDAPSPVSLTSHAYFSPGWRWRHPPPHHQPRRRPLPAHDDQEPAAGHRPGGRALRSAPPAPSARRGWTTPAAVVAKGYDHAFLLNNSDFEPADEPFVGPISHGPPG